MRLAIDEGRLKGVRASHGGPMISHLLFADDCILFGEASLGVVRVLKDVLVEYEMNSGQCVNFDKSSSFFNANVSKGSRHDLARNLGVRYSNNLERYSGFSNSVGHNKKASFLGLKDRMQKKVDGWCTKFVLGWEGSFHKVCSSSNPDLHHVLLPFFENVL